MERRKTSTVSVSNGKNARSENHFCSKFAIKTLPCWQGAAVAIFEKNKQTKTNKLKKKTY